MKIPSPFQAAVFLSSPLRLALRVGLRPRLSRFPFQAFSRSLRLIAPPPRTPPSADSPSLQVFPQPWISLLFQFPD